MGAVVEVDKLTKRYGSLVAADAVTFDVAEGEIFGLLGRNGAGKTTTVECIQELRHADGGHVRVLGFDPATDAARLRRHIGSQLQESALPDRLKVWEALDLFGSLTRAPVDSSRLLEEWGLADKRDSAFATLSGGQRQRLFVALALLNDPRVVFLDEMTTGLDPAARRVAWELIRTVADRGTTVVLVTHFMDEAEYVPEMRLAFRVDGLDLSWLAAVPTVRKVNRHGGCVDVEGVDRWSWAARTSCAVRASLQVAALAVCVIVRRSRTHVTGLIRTA